MSLDEVFEENPTITKSQAVRCVREHSVDINDFFSELGDLPEYSSRSVLEWLGY
jgi:hypothetical protein